MRLFIGIPLEEKLLNEINNLCIKFKNLRKTKFVKKENFHITLKFIGETDEENIKSIINTMKNAFANEESFFITTNRVSAFPSEKKAKVIWFNIDKNYERIKELYRKLEEDFKKINFFSDEKEYIPHITVARTKESRDISEEIKNLNFEFKSKVTEIVLYQSILRTEGPVYNRIFEKKLI